MLRALAAAWLVAGLPLTAARALDWSVGEAELWGQAHAASPAQPRPAVNLGNARLQAGDPDGARALYEQALLSSCDRRRSLRECREGTVAARANLVVLDAATGHLPRARRELEALEQTFPLQENLRRRLREAVR